MRPFSSPGKVGQDVIGSVVVIASQKKVEDSVNSLGHMYVHVERERETER